MSIHPGSIWLDQNWPTPGVSIWVAADRSGIVSEADTFPLLIARIRAQGLNLRDLAIAQIPVGIVQ